MPVTKQGTSCSSNVRAAPYGENFAKSQHAAHGDADGAATAAKPPVIFAKTEKQLRAEFLRGETRAVQDGKISAKVKEIKPFVLEDASQRATDGFFELVFEMQTYVRKDVFFDDVRTGLCKELRETGFDIIRTEVKVGEDKYTLSWG